MTAIKKYTTTIRISVDIREKLREQADKLGMDMSSYIAYLVMYKEEQEEAKKMTLELLKSNMAKGGE